MLKGTKHSLEARAKISMSRRGKLLGADHKRKLIDGNRASWANPEKRARRLASIRAGFDAMAPEKRIERSRKLSVAFKGRVLTPEHRKRLSAALLGRTVPANVRLKIGEATRKRFSEQPALKQVASDRARRMWADPAMRIKLTEGLRTARESPEYRKHLSRAGESRRGIRRTPEQRNHIRLATIASYVRNPELREQRRRDRAKQVFPQRSSLEKRVSAFLEARGTPFLVDRGVDGMCGLVSWHRFDFVLPDQRLVIEADGCWFHACPIHWPLLLQDKRSGRVERDRAIDSAIESLGWKMIRLWEHEIKVDDFRRLEEALRGAKEVIANEDYGRRRSRVRGFGSLSGTFGKWP